MVVGALFSLYRWWCKGEGIEKPLSKQKFGKILKALFSGVDQRVLPLISALARGSRRDTLSREGADAVRMTEAEWLACTYPTPMLIHLQGKASDRKLRLFQVAVARLVWDRVPDGEMRDAVEAAERYADGLVPEEQIGNYWRQFHQRAMGRFSTPQPPEWRRGGEKNTVFTLVYVTTLSAELLRQTPGYTCWTGDIDAVYSDLPPLLRDIFGNPFRPVTVDPSWVTSTAVALARGIYADRAFDRLPILAAALEEAGCDDGNLLAHCRGEGPHIRGCWAVDLVLGK